SGEKVSAYLKSTSKQPQSLSMIARSCLGWARIVVKHRVVSTIPVSLFINISIWRQRKIFGNGMVYGNGKSGLRKKEKEWGCVPNLENILATLRPEPVPHLRDHCV